MLALVACLAVSGTVRLTAVGDLMLARWVEKRIDREGPAEVLRAVKLSLRSDLVVGNLECVLSSQPVRQGVWVPLHARPASAKALRGFDVLNLANNHALDCGPAGLKDTQAALHKVGIKWSGNRLQPLVITRNGLKIALFGVSQFRTPGEDGIVYADNPKLPGALKNAREQSDVLIVMMHWGDELKSQPSAFQKSFASKLARQDVDLVIGSHPHVLQRIESIRGAHRKCLVAYSLGNFVFDAKPGPTSESEILEVELTKAGVKGFTTKPVSIRRGFPTPTKSGTTHA